MTTELGTCENLAREPTVLKSGPYRFFFYSSDRSEPPHVHVTRERKEAKFWVEPVRLQYNRGFAQNELHKVEGSGARAPGAVVKGLA